jgi:hypothetical protein
MPKRKPWAHQGCTSAGIGCLDCKQPVIEAIQREQQPWRERGEAYLSNPKQVHWIVEMGTERARTIARQTMKECARGDGHRVLSTRDVSSLLMLAATLLFSTMGVCVKLASAYYGAGEIVLYRSLVGALFIAGSRAGAGAACAPRCRRCTSGAASPASARWRCGSMRSASCRWPRRSR